MKNKSTKKVFATLAMLVFTLGVFASPMAFRQWRAEGNTFPGGYQGFVSYFTWLTPANRAAYIADGKFDRFGSGLPDSQAIADWKTQFEKTDWNNGGGYSYQVVTK